MSEFFSALASQAFLQNAMAAGLLASLGCGVMGSYVVVKRMAFLAGGIAHAVLGGMGMAYYFGGDPLLGAVAAAVLAAGYGIDVVMHGDDLDTLEMSVADAPMWGLGNPENVPIARRLSAGDAIEFGGESGKVLHTPGHTKGGMSILFDGTVFVGDTLFARSIGRTDFFGGDMETLLASVRRELFTLPDDTVVYTGHGPATTIGEEKRQNPFFDGTF